MQLALCIVFNLSFFSELGMIHVMWVNPDWSIDGQIEMEK